MRLDAYSLLYLAAVQCRRRPAPRVRSHARPLLAKLVDLAG